MALHSLCKLVKYIFFVVITKSRLAPSRSFWLWRTRAWFCHYLDVSVVHPFPPPKKKAAWSKSFSTNRWIIYNQPEGNSPAHCKNRTTVATDDVDSCFCYSKNNCGVVTILYSHGPRAENNSLGYSQFNNFGTVKLIIGLCEESSWLPILVENFQYWEKMAEFPRTGVRS